MFYFYLLSIYFSLDDDDELALITPLPHTYFLPLCLSPKHFKIFIKSTFSDYVMMLRKMLALSYAECCGLLFICFSLQPELKFASPPCTLWII